MSEKDLKEYKTLCKEIESLEKRIQKAKEKDIEVVAGKVKASMSEFPYTEIRVGVQMNSPEQVDVQKRIIRLYQERLEKAEQKKLEIEQFIDDIEDPQLRLIFQYRYIDGMKQREIARKLHIDQSRVSRKILEYLKVA